MNRYILIGAFVAVTLGTGMWYFSQNSVAVNGAAGRIVVADNTVPIEPAPQAGAGGSDPVKTPSARQADPTMAEVAKHNSAESCYIVVNGGVYDVTSLIGRHPGGPEAILQICGGDASGAFNAQHGGQRKPEQELATFKIGILKQ